MMFSNNKDCVHLDSSSRRYAVIHVDKTIPWIEKYSADGNFDRLVDFIESDDGASAILLNMKLLSKNLSFTRVELLRLKH